MVDADIDSEVASLLRTAKQRYTTGRQAVVAVLKGSDGPLTISQILNANPSLSQSSVYRNLTILEDAGAVSRVVTGDDFSRYELAENLTEHHHHLICSDCGDVKDFSLDDATESNLDRALHAAAEALGFQAAAHRLDLFGSCGDCD